MGEEEGMTNNERVADIKQGIEFSKLFARRHKEIKPNINDDIEFLLSELDRMQVENRKFIEGLRWYAKQGVVYRDGEDWHVYHRAKALLKELGVKE